MFEGKHPGWFEKLDTFSAKVRLDDLGFPDVILRDPSQGAFNDLVEYEKKFGDNRSGCQAKQVQTYFVSSSGAPGLQPIPEKEAKIVEWRAWVAGAPRMVIARILLACNFIRDDDSEVPN